MRQAQKDPLADKKNEDQSSLVEFADGAGQNIIIYDVHGTIIHWYCAAQILHDRANQVIQHIKGIAEKSDPVQEVVEAMVLASSESEKQAITIKACLLNNLPKILRDRVQLQQFVVNLVINRIQAIPSRKSRKREIAIEIAFTGPGIVLVSVRDSSGGTPPSDLEHTFDEIFSAKTDGVGNGLAICRSIIIDHGGTVKVENDYAADARSPVGLPIAHSAWLVRLKKTVSLQGHGQRWFTLPKPMRLICTS